MSKKDITNKKVKRDNKDGEIDIPAHEEVVSAEPEMDPEEEAIAQLLAKNVKKVKKTNTVSVDDELLEMELERELEKDNWD